MTSEDTPPTKPAHQQRKPMVAFLLGACSGVVTESICYPFEYTKNAMQLDKTLSGKGMFHTMRITFQTSGMIGFYRGLDCLLAMAGPRVAIRFGANEFLRKYVFVKDSVWEHPKIDPPPRRSPDPKIDPFLTPFWVHLWQLF